MTESEYKTVVKLMIEKLERYKDEIAEKDAEIDGLTEKLNAAIAGQETLQKYIQVQNDKIYSIQNDHCRFEIRRDNIRKKAIKDFAERLCADRVSNDPVVITVKSELKEMVGAEDG